MNPAAIATLLRLALELGRDLVARGEMTEAQLDEALAAARGGQSEAIDQWRRRMDEIGRRDG